MLSMAKKRQRRKPQGRSRETGKTRSFNFEIEPGLDDALTEAAEREKRTKRAILTLALERYLANPR